MQQIAIKRGGRCLADDFTNIYTKLKWQCKNGHVWEAIPKNIIRGIWCSRCSGLARLTIEQMQKIARKHGGECLSKTYINAHTKLMWKCKKRHKWETAPMNVQRGSWCPVCAIEKSKRTKKD